jgi:hypothetical protein
MKIYYMINSSNIYRPWILLSESLVRIHKSV